ncbi:hypothetical protein HRR83_003866 [Exophiala dermatitidis]|uniref:Uncharacterized protein n=3 Tax=Exophiala dermatitidis TaxID=5970 RepID=H6BPQ0_EXODN|nr:uncharacterized protein HMPREF1120_01840 [Exophiala dermatitidis NIH/UT8656]KAJ4518844.1 hypothetical protein HRR75_002519 [Exophiala dermatitidis]EHY53653.1 hypothetical protein HMPREF1120_01840 [Exophiala dermatitidis NIH/UT8656]KAJ4522168.1 hypothetical protein HRR74_002750 [Exophiala dermatitidis]KAJ4529494.1 hypothetical protein HRR73_000519 [Exophiala dermatitidis]KAJ4543848.1 hypothetical protein HRR76_001908 [Exophiala dermatitidis]
MAAQKNLKGIVVDSTEVPACPHPQGNPNQEKLDEALPAKAWPREPVPLVPDTKGKMFMWIYDGVLLAVPLLLIAKIGLVIGAWRLDRSHRGNDIDLVSKLTTFLIEFNGQMTTAFTIVFVTVISTLVRRYALWKAQSGARVSELEQLQGSISLPSTIKLIWSLRAFTTTSVALVALWSFYYLGSQASKLEFQRVSSGSFHKMDGYIAGPNYVSGFNDASSSFNVADLNAALIAAEGFANPEYQSIASSRWGTDSIGSALVPDLNAILDQGWSVNGAAYVPAHPGRHGWVNVAHQSLLHSAGDYSSFVGRPVYFSLAYDSAGVMAIQVNNVLGDYTYHTKYLSVNCGRPSILPYESFPSGTYMNQSISFNMTEVRADAPRDIQGHPLREFTLATRWIPYNDQGITSYGSSRQTCNITYVNVDMKVHCAAPGCFPSKLRYANNTSRRNATSFNTPFHDDAFAAEFFSALLLSRGAQLNVSMPTTTGANLVLGLQNFIGPPPGYTGQQDNYEAFLAAEPRGLQAPLTLYFNSYYMLSQSLTGTGPTFSSDDPNFQPVRLHGALYDPHYAILWGWIAVDFVSCTILLIAAIVACWLRTRTLAPDIFGYVSSLTRDNPHIELPDNGTTLSGLQRARLLRDVKVKIGDVSSPDEETGRVGLAQVQTTSGVPVANLKPTVAYV